MAAWASEVRPLPGTPYTRAAPVVESLPGAARHTHDTEGAAVTTPARTLHDIDLNLSLYRTLREQALARWDANRAELATARIDQLLDERLAAAQRT